MPNIVDRIVGYINPAKGLSRHFARQQLARAYEAASPRDSWRPRRGGASANADHRADAHTLRIKARALKQNVPYINAGIEARVSYVVGTGIIPRATGKEADKLNELLTEWYKVCDADGRLDYFGMQAAAERALEVDGEVIIRLRPRLLTDSLPIPLQLQLLEIDWLDTTRTGTNGNNQIINGIEYDALGAVSAYWLWDQHPGDMNGLASLITFKGTSRRVSADYIIHLFAADRPGQGRGFTRLASVIPRVRDLQLYEDAELARKNLETRLSVLGTGDLSQMANPPQGGDSVDGSAARDGNLGELSSGNIIQVPPGLDLTVVEPKPAGGYVEYVKYQMHIIAAGMGVTYEMLTGDMSEVNFSSARVRRMDFKRDIEQQQWLLLIPKMLDRIHRAAVDGAVLAGKIRARDYSVEFSPPKWEYVNPEQDVDADLKEVGAGLCSISEKLRQRGYNPATVFKELASDFNALKDLGILEIMLFMQRGNMPTQPATASKTKPATP
jgi:lambda family phage portal protein